MGFSYKDVSTYRQQIMGLAMIWVVLFHYQLIGIPSIVTGHGFTGVDLFFFVSGLGLYHSMSNNNDIPSFYKKRFFRVIPLYFFAGFILEIIKGDFNICTYLWNYSTLGFWTNGSINEFGWFIPGIIVVYVLFPFYYRTIFYDRIEAFTLTLLFVLLFFYIFYNSVIDNKLISDDHFLLLYRMPVFFLGTIVGYCIKEEKNGQSFLYLSFLIFIFAIIHYISRGNIRLWYMASTFLTPSLIILACMFFKRFPSFWLKKVGDSSLEIFIIHLFPIILYPNLSNSFSESRNATMISLCIFTCLLGVITHFLINKTKSFYLFPHVFSK